MKDFEKIVHHGITRIRESGGLSEKEKVISLYNLFTFVSEEATLNERIVFTTLFSRIAFIGNKYSIDSRDLHFMHLFRRANEKLKYDHEIIDYITLGEYVIYLLLYYTEGGDTVEMDCSIAKLFSKERSKTIGFRSVIEGLITEVNDSNYSLSFIDESDGSEIHVVSFDIADKNEIFNQNIVSISKHIKLPIHANLIDVEIAQDGSWIPQGLVIMPNYLVDVTSIANCFNDYGAETLLALTSRYKTIDTTSIPLLLGNVANIFLDEIVSDPAVKFKSLVPFIFKYNPVAISLFSDEDIRDIVAKAKMHFTNLKRVINIEAPALGLERSKMYLEPSFFSRDFGMQGRLDLFHHDETLGRYDIIELKSGSPYRANVYGLSNNHYVQTLLYDLLVKSTFAKKAKPSNYILYSKLSSNGLKYAPSARAQQYESMKVRNELMILEYISAYDLDKYRGLLDYMKPKSFPKVKGFSLSDIDQFSKLYSSIDDVTRDYLLEFTAFVKREQFLSKTGVHGLENSNGLAAIWLENFEEKEDRFAVLKQLEIKYNTTNEEIPTLTLAHSKSTSELANFRVGDIAILYPHNDVPQAVLRNQVFKCGILERTNDHVVVKLRSRQYNHSIFKKYKYWNIEEDKLDSSFTKSYRSIYKFVQSKDKMKGALLGLRAPKGTKKKKSVEHLPELTQEQNEILIDMVSAKEYYLLWGPPGTGKTSVMIKSYIKYMYENTEENILLLAYTNRAVDEICDAFISIGKEYEEKYIRVGSSTACGPRHKHRILERYISECTDRKEILGKLEGKRIFIGTISSMINKPELFKLKNFSTAVIDEASQILEPNIVGLLTHVEKFIMVGDHKQLPAVVQQDKASRQVKSKHLRAIGITDMSMSLFERLYQQCIQNNWTSAYGLLSRQGRMHEDLMRFPGVEFYENQLKVLEGIDRLRGNSWPLVENNKEIPTSRLLYVSTKINEGLNYKTNLDEANQVATLLSKYVSTIRDCKGEIILSNIGVITPYRAQIALIKKTCIAREVDITNITIDTVERYQGGARDLIIISLCVNKVSQFRSLVSLSVEGVDRKLNVALTRAKEQIVILGNEKLLSNNKTYEKLIKACERWTL